ncbi:NAD(P)/FAD-dependent oxidoreductase [Nocardioides zeae]|uniref:NAD(P)/FAD-dependent oxidoreductase n=1 Tax=Nocardioides imazamoxiresistens TaxID=3231893 RepID=A0ABU3Q2L7_9ACTN|nr:NAD(P)/FAD-dependent oxidoreductase [Nocardioides zeae]MDT9595401.1 NAD(P)/FAD-dependent oxidoreductase [Nocardioides zeae]
MRRDRTTEGTAVVVGSGPNGLAAAIRLARAGLRVTVLEAAATPGGGCRSEVHTAPGLLHDDCAGFHPLGIASPFLSSLGLERHGLRWRWADVDLAHPLDGGRAGLLGRDPRLVADSLDDDHGTGAGERWRRLFAPATGHFADVVAEALRPVLHVPRHPLTLARFGARAVLPATTSARLLADEAGSALFTGIAAHGFGRLDRPLTSAVGLLLGAAAQVVGWPVAAGGSAAIVDALVATLEEHGGRVLTGVRVTALDAVAEQADLDAPPDLVLLDTAPAGALQIVGDLLPTGVRRSFTRFRYGPAAWKVDLAVEGGVPWTAEGCRRAGVLHVGGSTREIAAAEAATARGRMPERPFVLVGQQHLADPSRSAGDVHPLYAYAHVPNGYDGDATPAVLAQLERFAPGLRERVVATAVRGPAALEEHDANYVGGDIAAGAATARQIVFRPRPGLDPYSLGVPGLYLCSASTPPGAGVHGMSGFHAAGAALRDLARSRRRGGSGD